MEVTVTFRHLDSNDSLKAYAQEKVSRIEKYVNKITEVHVILSLEKRRHIAEVIVHASKTSITATEETEENMYSAIDLVMDKIERQLRKHKGKITNHKDQHRRARHNVYPAAGTSEPSLQPDIIKSESVFVEPMTASEALERIHLGDEDFFVFKNIDTEKVNVLYKRQNGEFGLVEPEN